MDPITLVRRLRLWRCFLSETNDNIETNCGIPSNVGVAVPPDFIFTKTLEKSSGKLLNNFYVLTFVILYGRII
jgi:hypothetical protein